MLTSWRETKVGDAVLWGLVERNILGDVTRSVGLACRRGGRGSTNAAEEGHRKGRAGELREMILS